MLKMQAGFWKYAYDSDIWNILNVSIISNVSNIANTIINANYPIRNTSQRLRALLWLTNQSVHPVIEYELQNVVDAS